MAGDMVKTLRLLIYGLLILAAMAALLLPQRYLPPASAQISPDALASSSEPPSPSATEAPFQIAVVDLNKLLVRHKDYNQLLALQSRIDELGRALQPASLGPVDFREGQAELMRMQQNAGAEMRSYVGYTREMLQLKQRSASEELAAREKKLRDELNKLYKETREAIQKESRSDIRKREARETPTPSPSPAGEVKAPEPVKTPNEPPAETSPPEPQEEEELEPSPTQTQAAAPEPYNPAEDPEFIRERKALQKQLQAYVSDLFALRDRQAAARKLELEKELSEKLSARRRELDKQIAEYESQIMRADQNTKLNLQLKMMNAENEEAHKKIREELARIIQEENEKKEAKRRELNAQYEQQVAAEKAAMEQEFARYKDELTAQVKKKIAAEEKRMEEKLNQKIASLAAAKKASMPSPAPVTPRPTRKPRPRRTAVQATPAPLPTLPPPSPRKESFPTAAAPIELEGSSFEAPKLRKRYEEKRKALIEEFHAFKRQLEVRIRRENELSALQVKGKEQELNARIKAYQAGIIQELQEKNRKISVKEQARQKKVQKAIDDLLKQKLRLIESITAELKEKVSAVAQREGFNLVVASYISNVHCTDLTDLMLQEMETPSPVPAPQTQPSVNVPVGVPQATSTFAPGGIQGTP
jgi:hypothetical protein